jgi:C-terminal processing protease CtpA/Prc
MPLSEQDKAEIVDRVKHIVTEKHVNVVNPNQDYSAWTASVDARRSALLLANDEVFENGVRDLLQALGSSHTGFYKQNGAIPAPHSIHATVSANSEHDRNSWMFVDVIEDGAADRGGIRPGDLLVAVDGEPIAPPRQPTFRLGRTHRVTVESVLSRHVRDVDVSVPDRAAKDRPLMVEPKSVSHKMIERGLGYVRVASFPGTVGLQFAAALDRALSDLKASGCDHLVVDLRGNIGGGLGSLRLMSYLCPGKLPIGYSLTRRRLRSGYDPKKLPRIGKIPSTKLSQIGMALRFKVIHKDRSLALFTEGLGPQPWHGRTTVLINEHTASAAEMVAGFVKENALAKLVGTRSSGQVLGGANFKLRAEYTLRIPVAGWYSWSGSCIEGCGVEPDHVAPAVRTDLASDSDRPLRTALDLLQSSVAENGKMAATN